MSEQTLEEQDKPKEFGWDKDFVHPCALHVDIIEVDPIDDENPPPGCPECGKIINTDDCWWCGATWIRWGNSWDDVCADGSATLSGDFMCCRCAEEYEDEERESWDEDANYFGEE